MSRRRSGVGARIERARPTLGHWMGGAEQLGAEPRRARAWHRRSASSLRTNHGTSSGGTGRGCSYGRVCRRSPSAPTTARRAAHETRGQGRRRRARQRAQKVLHSRPQGAERPRRAPGFAGRGFSLCHLKMVSTSCVPREEKANASLKGSRIGDRPRRAGTARWVVLSIRNTDPGGRQETLVGGKRLVWKFISKGHAKGGGAFHSRFARRLLALHRTLQTSFVSGIPAGVLACLKRGFL